MSKSRKTFKDASVDKEGPREAFREASMDMEDPREAIILREITLWDIVLRSPRTLPKLVRSSNHKLPLHALLLKAKTTGSDAVQSALVMFGPPMSNLSTPSLPTKRNLLKPLLHTASLTS